MAKVDMESLKPNSNKYKKEGSMQETRSHLTPVVQGQNVVTTKKTLGQKFTETFIGEDIQEVKRYVFWDMVLPGVKNFILDMLSMMFFGERSFRMSDRDDRGYRDYTSSYRGRSFRERSERDRGRNDRLRDDRNVDYRHIVLRFKRDAKEVVDSLHDRIDYEGEVSIADLMDLVGLVGEFTDCDWGWTSKRDIGIRPVSNGFLIDVAPAEDLRYRRMDQNDGY